MRKTIAALALVALLLTGAATVYAAPPEPAAGSFEASVDFSSFTFTPRGTNCLLTVDGTLDFTGTIEGEATGTTTALIFASCEAVQEGFTQVPPVIHRDVFHSDLHFVGTVNDEPVEADVTYQGRSAEGGAIDGMLRFTNGVHAILEVDGQVAVGGSYEGRIVGN